MEQKESLTPTILRGIRADRLANAAKQGRGSCGGTSPLPPGKAWRPHVGRRQRERGLRQNWALFEKLIQRAGASSYAAATRERLLDAFADEPDAEFGVMNVTLGAYLAVQETRKGPVTDENWIKALNDALNHWEALADASKKQAEADGAVL